jgi:LAO/AO transport system kinase
MKRLALADYQNGILAGNRNVLSKAITLCESQLPEDQVLARSLLANLAADPSAISRKEKSFRIGITGVPGVGKSTFIESLGQHLVAEGKQIAILAIDPSSKVGKGSILGDKTRMEELTKLPEVFVRPSPTAGTLGGITVATRNAIFLCEAAGFDTIIIETVGVGQSEVAVRNVSDVFVLLLLPNAGDEIQGMKRGIMEMADLLIVNKADGSNILSAKQAKVAYQTALHLFPLPESQQVVDVLLTSNTNPKSVEEVWQSLLNWQGATQNNGWWVKQRRLQQTIAFEEQLNYYLIERFYATYSKEISEAMVSIGKGADGYVFLQELIDKIR